MKSYEVKLYSRTGTFKQQIQDIVSDVSFIEEQNGWQSNMTLSVVGELSDYAFGDIVEIREVDKTNKEISNTYSGIITNIDVVEFQKSYILNLELYGVFTRLSTIIYASGWSRKFEKSWTAGTIIKDIIDSFNAVYGGISGTKILQTNLIRYTTDSIDTSWTTLAYDFDFDDCLWAIRKVAEDSGYIWFVGADGVFHLKKESDLPIKYLTFDREIIAITKRIKTDEMKNKLYLQVHGDVELTYQDTPSQTIYWVYETRESDTDIKTNATAEKKATELMTKYGYELDEVTLSLKPQKSSDFTPLVRISTLNTRTPIIGKSIVRVDKTKSGIKLAIGDYISLSRTIKKIV